ncbi:MAG: PAS domain-containing protein [Bacteroidales bacterium]|nr:PAS domain-containing protein [Bacteroidales bacterium]
MNWGATEMYQWKLEELLGKQIHEVLNTEFVDYKRNIPGRLILDNGMWKGEVVQQRKDGGKVYVLSFMAISSNPNTHQAEITIVNKDITLYKNLSDEFYKQDYLIKRIFESSVSIIFIYDFTIKQFVYLNNKISQVLGYSTVEMLKMPIRKILRLIYPDDRLPYIRHLRKLFYGTIEDQMHSIELRLKDSKGKWRWFFSRDVVFNLDKNQRPVQFVSDMAETTKIKESDQKIKGYAMLLDKAENLAQLGSWELNTETYEVIWSKGMYKILGMDPDKLTPNVETTAYYTLPQQYYANNLKDLRPWSKEFQIRFKDNKEITVVSSADVYTNPRENVKKVFGILQDVTERRKVQMALKKEKEISELYFKNIGQPVHKT